MLLRKCRGVLRLSARRRIQDAGRDGHGNRSGSRYSQQQLSAPIQVAGDVRRHDFLDARFEIGAAHSGGADQRRFQIELADVQDSFGIDVRVCLPQNVLVAGALALFNEAGADPPDQRMKPEDGFHHHVDGGGEIVAAADVAELVGNHGFQLLRGEAVGDSIGQ